MNISMINRQEIYRYLVSINQHKYVTYVDGSSLLHLTLNENTSADDYFIDRTCKYISLIIIIIRVFLPICVLSFQISMFTHSLYTYTMWC